MRGASLIAAVATALLVPLSSAKCAQNDSAGNAAIAGCGDLEEVTKCFASGVKSSQLFDCLVSSGCTEGQAETVQHWHDGDCEDVQANGGDLRRRQAVRRSQPKITAIPTVAPRRAEEAGATIAAVPAVTVFARAETSLTCLKTETIDTSQCVTSTVDGTVSTTCQATTTESIGCNDGLICSKDSQGLTLCMKSQAPDLAGIIVSCCLSAAFCAMFGSVLFMSCRTRSRNRLAEKQREAMLIASGAKLGASASEAHLPLMQPQAAQAGHNRDVSADYGGPRAYSDRRPNSRRASPSGSPFRDVSATRGSNVLTKSPPPAPGSGDMGLGTEARNPLNMEDNDIGYNRHS